MKIKSVQSTIVEIPFDKWGNRKAGSPLTWKTLETVLVRIEDDIGNVGWGEAFGYFTADASKACIDRLIAPVLEGAEIDDIARWNRQTQLQLHIFGRYGITQFAISGVDIALWDLLAKRENKPLHTLLGTQLRQQIPAYASLVGYGDNDNAPAVCKMAIDSGFRDIKLHEVTIQEIARCRDAIGYGVPLATDVNCGWSLEKTVSWLPQLHDLDLAWLEEPIFPPEDFISLSSLRDKGVSISAGENWCTAFQFQQALNAKAVDSIQPSVTKVGGISACLDIARMACEQGTAILPHCPYFGPGFFATMQLAAVQPGDAQIEFLFVEPEAWLCDIEPLRQGHLLTLPDTAGHGFEPNSEVLARYRR